MAPAEKAYVGMDWGTAKVAVAIWDPTAARTRVVTTPEGEAYLPNRVAFRETTERGGRVLKTIIPVPQDWERDADSLEFHAIKQVFPAIDDPQAATFIAKQIFEFWRKSLPQPEAHISVTVPITYSQEHAEILCEAGRQAGFASCSPVSELIAAVLAFVPYWHDDAACWELLQEGQCVWVIDCGYMDLKIGVVHIQREDNKLHFASLAGDCLEDFGAFLDPKDTVTVAHEVFHAFENLEATAFDGRWPNMKNQMPSRDRANWIVCAGGGANLASARDALQKRLGGSAVVFDQISPTESVAAGVAVHAAMQGSQLPYQCRTIRRRLLLGLRTELPNSLNFIAISKPGDVPPCQFERAFQFTSQLDHPVEITFASALPGGDQFTGLHTFVFEPERLLALDRPVLLVQGHMEDWTRGTVQIREAARGSKLGEARFQLPYM